MEGVDFLDTHETFGGYYDKALSDFDYFMEHAILTGETEAVPNMSDVLMNPNETAIAEWKPVTGLETLSVEDAWEEFYRVGQDYLDALDLCREHCEKEGYMDIVSDIDNLRSEWALEIDYKAKRTLGK
jgi:DNA-binding ferritin-like protein